MSHTEQEKLDSFKKTLKCQTCPEDTWYCLEFHHIDSTDKDRDVTIAGLRGEILNWFCLCSCCHKKVHRGDIVVLNSEYIRRRLDVFEWNNRVED